MPNSYQVIIIVHSTIQNSILRITLSHETVYKSVTAEAMQEYYDCTTK